MNTLSRSVLTLYSYDADPENIELSNVLRQCINLISVFPMLSVYGYQAHRHYNQEEEFIYHNPEKHLSTAENILSCSGRIRNIRLLKQRSWILRWFSIWSTAAVITRPLPPTWIFFRYGYLFLHCGSAGSLKGPKHGGANIKVVSMFHDMKKHIKDPNDEDEIRDYLLKLLHKEAFDKRGALFTVWDMRYILFQIQESSDL